MKKFLLLAAAPLALAATPSHAVIVSTNAANFPADTSPFGALGTAVGTSAISTGIDFSYGNKEGVFSDPPNGFCGINANNICDLISDVDGRIVVLNSLAQGLTSYIWAEAGFAAAGSLTLSAFGVGNNLLASALNGNPLGPTGRTTFEISRGGADIAYFRISGGDTYAVTEIRIETPLAVGPGVPEPATWAMMLGGFGLVGGAMRRRQKVSVTYA